MTGVSDGRLAQDVPATGEVVHDLARLGGARIEHIVSSADTDNAVQAQPWDEWVLVLHGRAVLDVGGRSVPLATGDWILLPAGQEHRVVSTEHGTQWLAVHAADTGSPAGPAPGPTGDTRSPPPG